MNNISNSPKQLNKAEIHDLLFLIYDLIDEDPKINLKQSINSLDALGKWVEKIKLKEAFKDKEFNHLREWVFIIVSELVRIEYTPANKGNVYSTIIDGFPFTLRIGL